MHPCKKQVACSKSHPACGPPAPQRYKASGWPQSSDFPSIWPIVTIPQKFVHLNVTHRITISSKLGKDSYFWASVHKFQGSGPTDVPLQKIKVTLWVTWQPYKYTLRDHSNDNNLCLPSTWKLTKGFHVCCPEFSQQPCAVITMISHSAPLPVL